MRIFATIRLALRALRRNKMRSMLTMLGIIIGVGSVIAAVSITTGATKQVEDKVASLGQNVVTVFSGNFTSGAMRGGWGSAPTLTVDDTAAIKNEVANVVAVSPEVTIPAVQERARLPKVVIPGRRELECEGCQRTGRQVGPCDFPASCHHDRQSLPTTAPPSRVDPG